MLPRRYHQVELKKLILVAGVCRLLGSCQSVLTQQGKVIKNISSQGSKKALSRGYLVKKMRTKRTTKYSAIFVPMKVMRTLTLGLIGTQETQQQRPQQEDKGRPGPHSWPTPGDNSPSRGQSALPVGGRLLWPRWSDSRPTSTRRSLLYPFQTPKLWLEEANPSLPTYLLTNLLTCLGKRANNNLSKLPLWPSMYVLCIPLMVMCMMINYCDWGHHHPSCGSDRISSSRVVVIITYSGNSLCNLPSPEQTDNQFFLP